MAACWIAWGFILLMNGIGWWAIRHDKKAARARGKGHRESRHPRIAERWLWTLAFFGGFPAMMVAMGRYRHKTRKVGFQIPFFVAAFVSSLVWAGWLSVLGCFPFEALLGSF